MIIEDSEKLSVELEKLKEAIAEIKKILDEAFSCITIALERTFAGNCETFSHVFRIGLPRSPLHIAPLWRTSRAYYRPSEKAGSVRIRLFARRALYELF